MIQKNTLLRILLWHIGDRWTPSNSKQKWGWDVDTRMLECKVYSMKGLIKINTDDAKTPGSDSSTC